jgi:uncharacterized lipoprotein YmbA
MKLARFQILGAFALLGAACASAPIHYYTLVPASGAASESVPAAAAPLQFELSRIGVPAQVDQPQLVVREGVQRVALLDGERWIAPLGDEVRAALAADLARELPGQDVTGLGAGGNAVLHIKVDLRRFDSFPGSYALIEAAWTLRAAAPGAHGAHGGGQGDAHHAVLECTTSVSEPVGPGMDALVVGHQRALAKLAAAIAGAAHAMAAGGQGSCP